MKDLEAGAKPLSHLMLGELYDSLSGILTSQQEGRGGKDKLDFVGWVNAYHPKYKWYEWNRRLAAVLQDVAEGRLLRLMVFIQPRLGKSEVISRLFTAYYLYLYPDQWVGLCSYSSELATTLSRSARDNFVTGGGTLRSDSSAVQHWQTDSGGGMWSAGVGGGITGKGGDLLVVDDPVKDAAQAASGVIQEIHRDWWQTTFRSRRAGPHTRIVVVNTRWHEMDLSGWLLVEELKRERPERWHVVAWEAIKEPEDREVMAGGVWAEAEPEKVQRVANYVWPSTVTLEPDWRKPGEVICPERFPLEDVLNTRDGTSSYYWAALYQQRPRPREGALFKAEHFIRVSASMLPRMRVVARFWDYAASEKQAGSKPDYTSGVKLGIGVDGHLYILDMVRGQWASGKRDAMIDATVQQDGYGVAQGREQEPGASGKDTANLFRVKYAPYHPFVRVATGSKFERADPLIVRAQTMGVRVLDAPWAETYIDEMVGFGSGAVHDDIPDSSSGAYQYVLQRIRQMESVAQRAGSVSMRTYR